MGLYLPDWSIRPVSVYRLKVKENKLEFNRTKLNNFIKQLAIDQLTVPDNLLVAGLNKVIVAFLKSSAIKLKSVRENENQTYSKNNRC